MSDSSFSLKHGNEFPYDAPNEWWNESSGKNPPPPKDWAHSAARGIIANLQDRRGIKHELSNIDEETRAEIIHTLADIIRLAAHDKVNGVLP